MIGPKGFERDFTPTVLEYLYERKEISYIWGAFVFVWGAAWGARNVVVVTHSNNLNACLSDPKVDFLEAAIVDLGCPLECPFADHALRIKYLRDQDTKALRLAEWYRAFKQGP